jgi:D-alanyl-D-alanine carboxypeptidase/D-alanyl-D-alanine-endopeptidase (penicillin-binding protein 4)
MMKLVAVALLCFISCFTFAQSFEVKLADAVKIFEADSQFKHAVISLYVVDTKTGKVVFDKNSQLGLAPASCLKVVTSAAAFELLGKDYRYKTELSYNGAINGISLDGNLYLKVLGDPTLGSWRWETTKEEHIEKKIVDVLKKENILILNGEMIVDERGWDTQATPGGWTWEDIGNYYGAGARALNWHENQYDLILKPGKKPGDSVEVLGTQPEMQFSYLTNELKTGKEGSGDNSIIYLPEDGLLGYVRGTVPAGKERFVVSGAMPNASHFFIKSFLGFLAAANITIKDSSRINSSFFLRKDKMPLQSKSLLKLYSPSLDSINYWFLQKSVNLYGEAFVKTIAYEKTGFGSTVTGISIIKDFWNKNGVEKSALNIIDGSGLSPANRITTNALVTVMQYAKKQSWYPSFYNALPEQNGIKMKSGYIGGVRSYTGYIKSKSGTEYTFSFIINNYDGSPGAVREKMWKLLDVLK